MNASVTENEAKIGKYWEKRSMQSRQLRLDTYRSVTRSSRALNTMVRAYELSLRAALDMSHALTKRAGRSDPAVIAFQSKPRVSLGVGNMTPGLYTEVVHSVCRNIILYSKVSKIGYHRYSFSTGFSTFKSCPSVADFSTTPSLVCRFPEASPSSFLSVFPSPSSSAQPQS